MPSVQQRGEEAGTVLSTLQVQPDEVCAAKWTSRCVHHYSVGPCPPFRFTATLHCKCIFLQTSTMPSSYFLNVTTVVASSAFAFNSREMYTLTHEKFLTKISLKIFIHEISKQ